MTVLNGHPRHGAFNAFGFGLRGSQERAIALQRGEQHAMLENAIGQRIRGGLERFRQGIIGQWILGGFIE